MSRIIDAINSIDEIIKNLNHQDTEVRIEAAGKAQYAFCGYPGSEKGKRLMEAVAARLELKVNGHAEPVEPDHYVRERCADAMRLASESFDITKYLPVLRLSHSKDPHEWVREMVKDALPEKERSVSDLPLPKKWSTTRPMPELKRLTV